MPKTDSVKDPENGSSLTAAGDLAPACTGAVGAALARPPRLRRCRAVFSCADPKGPPCSVATSTAASRADRPGYAGRKCGVVEHPEEVVPTEFVELRRCAKKARTARCKSAAQWWYRQARTSA